MQNHKIAAGLLVLLAYGCGAPQASQLQSVDVGTEALLAPGFCKLEFEVNSKRRIRKWSVKVIDSKAIESAWGQRMEVGKRAKRGDKIERLDEKTVAFDFKTGKEGDGYGVLVPFDSDVTVEIDAGKRNGKKVASKRFTMPAKDLPTSDFVLHETSLEWKAVKREKRMKRINETASVRMYASCAEHGEPEAAIAVGESDAKGDPIKIEDGEGQPSGGGIDDSSPQVTVNEVETTDNSAAQPTATQSYP